jgi:predicted PurR-regulated permease PerM
LKQRLDSLNEPLRFLSEMGRTISEVTNSGQAPALRVEQSSGGILSGIFSTLTPAVTQFILFFGALIFYLIYQKEIRTSLVRVVRDRATRLTVLRLLGDVEDNMTIYFGTFTIVNVCLGIATTFMTWACGLPNPLLWGVLAAVINYVPYVGPAITTATLFVAGLLTFPSLYSAALAPLIYIGMTTVEGQFITPTIIGHRLTLNPFLVFLSIAFWTWLWGPIGAFLAVPLVMTGKILIRHAFPQDKPSLPQ